MLGLIQLQKYPKTTMITNHTCLILQHYLMSKTSQNKSNEAVASLKPNKNPECDSIHVNLIKAIYEELKRPLFYIFDQSLKSGIFPDKLKIAKVFPIYKSGKKHVPPNYRPISVLPCFSKILERIMYNRL